MESSFTNLFEIISKKRTKRALDFESTVNETFITPFLKENELSIKHGNTMRSEIQRMFKIVNNENNKTRDVIKKLIIEFEKETVQSDNTISNLESAIHNLGKKYLSELEEKNHHKEDVLKIENAISFILDKMKEISITYENDNREYEETHMKISKEIEEKKIELLSIKS